MTVPESVRDRLAAARAGHLATAAGSGRPHLVPVCFAVEGDRIYFAIDRKPKTGRALKRLSNLRENPQVSLLADHYEEDWSRLWWVRVDGRGAVLPAGPESERALDLLAAKYPQYRLRRPPGPVVRIDVEGWSEWSA